MLVLVTTVDHKNQRYPTTGDWHTEPEGDSVNLFVKVSKMGNWKYEFLVALHELIESAVCFDTSVSEDDVTAFDEAYEKARDNMANSSEEGLAIVMAYRDHYKCGCGITDISEPGDDEHAPYYLQHQFATRMELLMAGELHVDWDEYENANLALYEEDKAP